MSEQVLNLGTDAVQEKSFALETRTTDPVILPQPYSRPADYTAQYPTPLDPTEILTMCEEVSLYRSLPTERTALNAHTWREMTSLAFTSGSAYIAFADGECPEEYTHNGANTTVDIKNLGAKKTLSYRDIMHSRAVAGANWNGINTISAGFPGGEGMPGGDGASFNDRAFIADAKAKEMRLGMTLVLNGWDRLLALGNHSSNSLEFTGFEQWQTNYSCSFHTRSATDLAASGTFSAITFDRFLSESCAKPTAIFGHPQTIQEMMAAYYQLGYQGSQLVNFSDGNRITPGFNFGSFVNTGVGKLPVVADYNFTITDAGGGAFQGDLWAMRMTHNGIPLVYRLDQVPLSMNDLVPGCTAISFQIWAATSLIIKACCAHSQWRGVFTGRVATTCTKIG